jgi:hypothetical protein
MSGGALWAIRRFEKMCFSCESQLKRNAVIAGGNERRKAFKFALKRLFRQWLDCPAQSVPPAVTAFRQKHYDIENW